MSAQIYNITGSAIGNGSNGTLSFPQTNLTITNPNIALGNILRNMEIHSSNFKKYEIIESTEDLLTLSCTWQRLRQEIKSINKVSIRISSMLSDQLFSCIQSEDRAKAVEVREYYSKKLMMMALRDARLSQFRQDLKEYIQSDGKKFAEKFIPLVYRLPEFYDYDTKFDSEVKMLIEKDIPAFKLGRTNTVDVTLYPIKSYTKSNKKGKFAEYWMKDEKNCGYRFLLKPDNSCLGLWEREFTKDSLSATLVAKSTYRDELPYYEILSIQG